MLTKSEWGRYVSADYQPSSIMESLKIKYAAFATILSQLKSVILDEPDLTRLPYIIFSAKEAICDLQDEKKAPQEKAEPDTMLFTDYFALYIEELKTGRRLKHKSTDMVAESPSVAMSIR